MNKSLIDQYIAVSSYVVDEEYQNTRLDNCLISKLKGLPRSKIYSIIRKGEVRVNGSRSKPDRRLKISDVIRIPPYRIEEKTLKLGVIGLGFVGLPVASEFANKGFQVLGIEKNKSRAVSYTHLTLPTNREV